MDVSVQGKYPWVREGTREMWCDLASMAAAEEACKAVVDTYTLEFKEGLCTIFKTPSHHRHKSTRGWRVTSGVFYSGGTHYDLLKPLGVAGGTAAVFAQQLTRTLRGPARAAPWCGFVGALCASLLCCSFLFLYSPL